MVEEKTNWFLDMDKDEQEFFTEITSQIRDCVIECLNELCNEMGREELMGRSVDTLVQWIDDYELPEKLVEVVFSESKEI